MWWTMGGTFYSFTELYARGRILFILLHMATYSQWLLPIANNLNQGWRLKDPNKVLSEGKQIVPTAVASASVVTR
jgi:hypothetical protein